MDNSLLVIFVKVPHSTIVQGLTIHGMSTMPNPVDNPVQCICVLCIC